MRASSIAEARIRTDELQMEQEERRLKEVADWFGGLIKGESESPDIVKEIFEDYIEEKQCTFGDAEFIDAEFANDWRQTLSQELADRLLRGVPPAQGALVLKKTFI